MAGKLAGTDDLMPPLRSNHDALISAIILFYVLAVTAYGIGNRPFYVGADTLTYADYYDRYEGLFVNRFEPGFSILTFLIKHLRVGVRSYLSLLYIALCGFFTMFVVFSCLQDRVQRASATYIALVFAALFFSRWFENAAVNGIRQGLAAPLVYATLLFVGRRAFLFATLCGVTALCFHQSAGLAILVSPLMLLRERTQLYVFLGSCAAYIGGLNATLVRALPPLFGVNLYEFIVDYSSDAPLWHGPQFVFILYTCVFMMVFYGARYFLRQSVVFGEYVRIYSALSCMYFIFGIGAFSNRFAVYAWLFTSIPLARIVYEITTSPFLRRAGAIVGVVLGGAYFFMRVSGTDVPVLR